MADSKASQIAFEKDNDIQSFSSMDAVFKYSLPEQQAILARKPWEKE